MELLRETVFINEDQLKDNELSETKLYRYYWITDLLKTLETKRIILKKPHLWNDPFENLFLKSEIKNIDGKIADLSVTKEQIFAQCWTLKEESDLMWHSYIKGNEGAKVATTLGKLLKIISEYNFAFIKGVSYRSEKDILKYFSKPMPFNGNANPLFTTLFIKRVEFEEEKEVRLVFHDAFRNRNPKNRLKIANFNINDYKSDFAYINFEPNFLFSEIILHPQMSGKMVTNFKKRIGEYYRGEIKKSILYNIPKISLTIDMTSPETKTI